MHGIHTCCLTIAGSDSGGNAGVQADLRTFHAYRLHGCSVFTAMTAQNPHGVYATHLLPASFIAAQLDAVLGTYSIGALKTGMLADPAAIEAIADKIRAFPRVTKVIDPVKVATCGASLISQDALIALEQHLLPLATLITPNIPEAECLTGRPITGRSSIRDAARHLYDRYGAAVLIKGGHATGDLPPGEDTFFDGKTFETYRLPWLEKPLSTHGTGCTLAAAVVAECVRGAPLKRAVEGAKKYVHRAIAQSYLVGPDCGVLGF